MLPLKEEQLLTPRFVEKLTLKCRPFQIPELLNSSALSGQWSEGFNSGIAPAMLQLLYFNNSENLTPRFREIATLNYFVNSVEV